ncbi:hypothetical protein Lnau_0252 [Legionella nautarum]|uniref:Secreted protein n=1 Tax=Legionella nautarum TaxID=45070 RepID=A0A0W0X3R4_9GAMM|nr:hypothetical protein [Legionella nautarum]KTD39183.1 hypothetical protein Lnau_0252 [Legionella nautarum]
MTKLITVFLLLLSQLTFAENCITKRELFIENTATKVWKTTICPNQKLSFHVHHYSRVVIPEETGSLKVTYQSGKEDFINLKKQIPVYLSVAQGKEPHQDENAGKEPLHVTVIELKNG